MGLSAQGPVLVKLGGSLITDKGRPYTPRMEVIERLCGEVRRARQQRPVSLVLAHGGGSFPHVSASQYGTAQGATDARGWEGFVKVHRDAARLNHIVCQALAEAGEQCMPVQPSACAVARAGRVVSWDRAPLAMMLDAGLIPVPYGDVCVDQQQGCCIISTEEIFRHLAGALRPSRVLLLGKVDGVLDSDGQLIDRITANDLDRLRQLLAPSDGIADVTGGMLHKVQRSLELGLPAEIVNGLVPGLLERALLGQPVPGTVVG